MELTKQGLTLSPKMGRDEFESEETGQGQPVCQSSFNIRKHSEDYLSLDNFSRGVLSLSLLDDFSDVVLLDAGTSPVAESLLQELGGSLVELGVLDLEQFKSSLFVWGESSDASDNLSDQVSSLAGFSSVGRLSADLVSLGGDESLVKTVSVSLN